MANCLVAGLPAAGKSTYIGALAYLLQNPVSNQMLRYASNPDDLSYLNKLMTSWLNQKKLDRTTRGFANNIEFNVIHDVTGEQLTISLPDIAGEDFESIVQKNSEVVRNWSQTSDSLLLFINNWPDHTLAEDFGITEPEDKTKEPPKFTLGRMSVDIQNILLIKELYNIFRWKKLAIALSSWDLYKDAYPSPSNFIKQRSPFLHNFLSHYFPEAYIFGISAQGAEYIDNEQFTEMLIQKTENGERSYIVQPDGTLSYDLTIPLIELLY